MNDGKGKGKLEYGTGCERSETRGSLERRKRMKRREGMG